MAASSTLKGAVRAFKIIALRWRYPIITPIFAIVEAVLFILAMRSNICPDKNLFLQDPDSCMYVNYKFHPFKENPLIGPGFQALYKTGALEPYLVSRKHQTWRLLSSLWLNCGILHLLVSATGLLCLGWPLEEIYGTFKTTLIFFITGVGGTLFSTITVPHRLSTSAGAPIFGFIAALITELTFNRRSYKHKLIKLSLLLGLAAISLFVGMYPFVDNMSHIGAFAVGTCLSTAIFHKPQGFVLKLPPRAHLEYLLRLNRIRRFSALIWLASWAAISVGFMLMIILAFLRNPFGYCAWCQRNLVSNRDCCDKTFHMYF